MHLAVRGDPQARLDPEWTEAMLLVKLEDESLSRLGRIQVARMTPAIEKAINRDLRVADAMDLDDRSIERLQPLR